MWARQEELEAQPGWPERAHWEQAWEQCRTKGRWRARGAHSAASVAGVGEAKAGAEGTAATLAVLGALGHVFVPSETLWEV